MARKGFISFKTEDLAYKLAIQAMPGLDMIDKSLDEAIDSDDEDYIMRKIREEYLSDSTVTLHLIGENSAENLGWDEQKFIKRELQASLYDGENNPRSGILGIVLPKMYDRVFGSPSSCGGCGTPISVVYVNDSTTIKEFHRNYFIHEDKCHHTEDERYGVLVKWDDFVADPNAYIERAFEKRTHPIASKVRVRC